MATPTHGPFAGAYLASIAVERECPGAASGSVSASICSPRPDTPRAGRCFSARNSTGKSTLLQAIAAASLNPCTSLEPRPRSPEGAFARRGFPTLPPRRRGSAPRCSQRLSLRPCACRPRSRVNHSAQSSLAVAASTRSQTRGQRMSPSDSRSGLRPSSRTGLDTARSVASASESCPARRLTRSPRCSPPMFLWSTRRSGSSSVTTPLQTRVSMTPRERAPRRPAIASKRCSRAFSPASSTWRP